MKFQRRPDPSVGTFVVPALVFTMVLYVLPNLLNLGAAFTSWSTLSTTIRFTGFRNFQNLAQSDIFPVLGLTFRYALVAVAVQTIGALLLALALERSTIINGVLRAAVFLPVLVSPLAAGYIWRAILDPTGVLNQGLSAITTSINLQAVHVEWLGSQEWTIYVVGLVYAWKWIGLSMLIYLAGLQAIPKDIVEAASVEGATSWAIVRRVKFPLLMPAFTFNVTLNLIGALSSFDMIMAMTKGGPGLATETFNVDMLMQLGTGSYASAATISLVLSLMLAVISLPLVILLRRREIQL